MTKTILFFVYFIALITEHSAFSRETNYYDDKENRKYTLLEDKIKSQDADLPYPDIIHLYKENYVLPYYYSTFPYYEIYKGHTPFDQRLTKIEVKGQFSIFLPILTDFLAVNNLSMGLTYTQLFYWQLYTIHPFFRETDYQPTAYIRYLVKPNILLGLSFEHISNGVGNANERSWNRITGNLQTSTDHFIIEFNGWHTISLDSNNDNIEYFLGHGSVRVSYKSDDFTINAEIQNALESKFNRGRYMISAAYPLHRKNLYLYGQFFNGYGQNILEFNHFSQGFGIGFALNNTIY